MLLYFYNYISLDHVIIYFCRITCFQSCYQVIFFFMFLTCINTRLETLLCLETKLRTLLCFCRVPQSKFETNRSRGSWVIIRHQTDKARMFLYTLLAWEPSFAWNLIFPYKVNPLSLDFLQNNPRVLPSSLIKVWGKLV